MTSNWIKMSFQTTMPFLEPCNVVLLKMCKSWQKEELPFRCHIHCVLPEGCTGFNLLLFFKNVRTPIRKKSNALHCRGLENNDSCSIKFLQYGRTLLCNPYSQIGYHGFRPLQTLPLQILTSPPFIVLH